jgi:hypothetical protein
MQGTCVVIAGLTAIALGLSTPDATASTPTADEAFVRSAAAGSIGVPAAPPSLVEAPPVSSPAYIDGILAQRVLDDDEEKPKGPGEETDEPRVLSRKNPWVAMGLSALLPGAGQFYLDRSNPLAFAYVGVEALAWYLHFQWESDGDEKTREFEEYAWQGSVVADAGALNGYEVETTDGSHWSWERWRESFGQPEGCLQPDNIDYVGTDSTLVTFWFTNRREFYEDIGKYDKYDCGWRSSEFRDIYRSMRNETNDILERARLMTQVVLLNHLTSSIHAFFLARSHNKRVDAIEEDRASRELHWRFSPDPDYSGLGAKLWLTQKF